MEKPEVIRVLELLKEHLTIQINTEKHHGYYEHDSTYTEIKVSLFYKDKLISESTNEIDH